MHREVIKQSGEDVFLVVDTDRPGYARVLDFSQLKLFPPYPLPMLLEARHWDELTPGLDVEGVLKKIEEVDDVGDRVRGDDFDPGAHRG